MRKSISATIAQTLSLTASASPFSFLKEKKPVDLDNDLPHSRKNYAYEMEKEISNLMKEKGIIYATVTTASQMGAVVRSIVHLESLKKENPDLQNIPDNHPDISQPLPEGYYIVNPRYLTA